MQKREARSLWIFRTCGFIVLIAGVNFYGMRENRRCSSVTIWRTDPNDAKNAASNAAMNERQVQDFCAVDAEGGSLLKNAVDMLGLRREDCILARRPVPVLDKAEIQLAGISVLRRGICAK